MEITLNADCKWLEIEKKYPNMWAFITDIEEKDDEIIKCKVLSICSYDRMAYNIKKYKTMGIDFDCVSTTYSMPALGVLMQRGWKGE